MVQGPGLVQKERITTMLLLVCHKKQLQEGCTQGLRLSQVQEGCTQGLQLSQVQEEKLWELETNKTK